MARTRTGQHSGARQVSTTTGAEASADPKNMSIRVTRSQSREPVQGDAIRSQQRATQGRLTSPGDTHGVEIGHLNDINEDVSEESVNDGRQQSVLSTGLSARTTLSQDDAAEVRELDPEMVIDSFPNLLPSADDVLEFVFKELNGDLSFIETADSRNHKFLTKRVQNYTSQKESFSSQIYIRPDIVLRALLRLRPNRQIAPDPWRIDELIFKANLAGLIGHFSQCGNTTKQVEVLQALDSDFPRRFMDSLEFPQAASGRIGESVLAEETCLLALNLRTQLAVGALALNATDSEPDAHDAVIASVFLDGDYTHANMLSEELDATMLRGFDLFSDGDHPDFQEHVVERVKDLKAAFDEYEDADAISYLQEKYAWSDFRLRLVEWVKLRSEELSSSIIKRGGGSNLEKSVDNIITRLARKMVKIDPNIARILGDRINRAPRASGLGGAAPSSPAVPPRNQDTAGSVDKATNAGTKPPVSTTNSMQLFHHDEPDDEDEDEDEAFEQPVNPPPVRRPARSSRPAAASTDEAIDRADNLPDSTTETGKLMNSSLAKPSGSGSSTSRPPERRFIDRQADAHRVQFSQTPEQRSRLPGQRAESPSPGPLAPATGKRTRQDPVVLEDDEDRPTQAEPSQDRGFQGNPRSNQFVQRTASVPNSSGTEPSTLRETAASPSSPKRARQNPGQSTDPLPADLKRDEAKNKSSGQRAAEINLDNRRHARLQRSQPQSRTKWEIAEVTRLIDLIEEHGPAWATIKDQDEKSLNVFAIRDQVGLRDKARNLRVDFEIAKARYGTPMPTNFELVALHNKEYDKLEKVGVFLERVHVRSRRVPEE